MKGDFSRFTGERARRNHYNGVYTQDGRVALASDRNEFVTISGYQREIRTIDAIGICGAPIHDSGFRILHPGGNLEDLLISTGRFYAGGLLCETTPGSKLPIRSFPTNKKIKVDDVRIDGRALNEGEWVKLTSDENPEGVITKVKNISGKTIELEDNISAVSGHHHPFLSLLLLFSGQPDYPGAPVISPVEGRTDLLYLDAWERHITSIEDPELREVALGGPDTDTRLKVIAQVKIIRDVGEVRCEDFIDPFEALKIPADGRLTTRLSEPPPPSTPCELSENGGYNGLENRLYLVEVHQSGPKSTATFKWSRQNGAHVLPIAEFIPDVANPAKVYKIRLAQTGKDGSLKMKPNDWVEVTGDRSDLDTDSPGIMARVSIDPNDEMVLVLDQDVAACKDELHPKIRRWDTGSEGGGAIIPISQGPVFQLENGIEIEFSGENFQTGSYWVFEARTLTGSIAELKEEPPLGVRHHYCKLALVTWQGDGTAEIEDCRPEFPPLTELPDTGGCCTVSVGKGSKFQEIQPAIDSLEGGPGTVCIHPGIYLIEEPIRINGKNIFLKGCGGESYIINTAKTDGESLIFHVENARGITIRDLLCATLTGPIGIWADNTRQFELSGCTLVAGGAAAGAGVVIFRGSSADTRLHNNRVLGMTGVAYERLPGQTETMHISTSLRNNCIFALNAAVFKPFLVPLKGLEIEHNVLTGISKDLISLSVFPAALFDGIANGSVFSAADIASAKAQRTTGPSLESLTAKDASTFALLEEALLSESSRIKILADAALAIDFPTTRGIIDLSGGMISAQITGNTIIGSRGMHIQNLLNGEVRRNMIFGRNSGLIIGTADDIEFENNFFRSQGRAIQFTGGSVKNLYLFNNRITSSQSTGIEFLGEGQLRSQKATNILIGRNRIQAKTTGIALNSPGIILKDFRAIDNDISNCETFGIHVNVLDENIFIAEDLAESMTIFQDNVISVKGGGISTNAPGSKIVNNYIDIHQPAGMQSDQSRGIILAGSGAVVELNVIRAEVSPDNVIFSLGGIFIKIRPIDWQMSDNRITIRNNRITGGRQHGIEIGSLIRGLTIEGNLITGMGLCGITVREEVVNLFNLTIAENRITDCQRLVGQESWWELGVIVLRGITGFRMTDNVIAENGKPVDPVNFFTGVLYIEKTSDCTISGNQFLGNGLRASPQGRAVIHFPAMNTNGNTNITIVNNLIRGSAAASLRLGNSAMITPGGVNVSYGLDHKVVIEGNHFESPVAGPIVFLNCSRCIFSGNYVECAPASNLSVSLGNGWYVTAGGNMVSAPIPFTTGIHQVGYQNMDF